MKLLLVYQFCTVGGVETVLMNRLKSLAKDGIKFDVLFLYDFGGKKIFNEFFNSIYIFDDINKITALMEKEKYDCIISIDTPQIFLALNKLTFHPPVILEVHTTYEENLSYLSEIDKTNTSAIITPSNYMVSLIKQKIKNEIPIHVIPNSISDQFLNADNFPEINFKKKIIGWVGRLDYLKNWDGFLRIASHLKSLEDNFEFWIIGGAAAPESVRKDFFSRIKSNGILPDLKWYPILDFHFMPTFYRLISNSGGCFISTSINESFGMTILESMASKCPVVVPDVGGLPELVDKDSCGLLYPGGDIEKAALAVIKLTTDTQLRETIIDNAYRNVLSNYTCEKVINRWIDIIKIYHY